MVVVTLIGIAKTMEMARAFVPKFSLRNNRTPGENSLDPPGIFKRLFSIDGADKRDNVFDLFIG